MKRRTTRIGCSEFGNEPSLVPLFVEALLTGDPEGKNPQDVFLRAVADASPETSEAIGAAWNHKDGKGMNIEQDFTPIGDGRIVLRDYAEAMKEQEETSTKKPKGRTIPASTTILSAK